MSLIQKDTPWNGLFGKENVPGAVVSKDGNTDCSGT